MSTDDDEVVVVTAAEEPVDPRYGAAAEILERAVIVAIVNRKLMGIGPVVFAKPIRQAHVDRKFVGNAIVEFRDWAEGANVPIVVTRSVAIKMVPVEQVLIAKRHFALTLGRYPGLGEGNGSS